MTDSDMLRVTQSGITIPLGECVLMWLRRTWPRWMSSARSANAEATPRRPPRVVDAHCHLHDPRLRDRLIAVTRRAREWNVSHVASCACYEEDWTRLDTFLTSFTEGSRSGKVDGDRDVDNTSDVGNLQIVPSFGIHPWWADTATPASLASLRHWLQQYPDALIGEIGLCKSARGKQVDPSVQECVFHEQLKLAIDLQRGCVIHCVGAYGKLLSILQETLKSKSALPPVVILHSYSGPADMVTAFLTLARQARGSNFKIFFSLNAKQLSSVADLFTSSGKNPLKPLKVEAVCLNVPLDALLLETDAPDQAPTLDVVHEVYGSDHGKAFTEDGINEPALVHLAICGAAAIRGMPMEDLAAAVYANSCSAFAIPVSKNE